MAIIIPPTKNPKQDMKIMGVANNTLQSVSVTAQKTFDTENYSEQVEHYLPNRNAFSESYKESATSTTTEYVRSGSYGKDAGIAFGITFKNSFVPSWKYETTMQLTYFTKTTAEDGGTIEKATSIFPNANFDTQTTVANVLPFKWQAMYYNDNREIKVVNYDWNANVHYDYFEAKISKWNFAVRYRDAGLNINPNLAIKLILGGMRIYEYSSQISNTQSNNTKNIREYFNNNIVYALGINKENTAEGRIESHDNLRKVYQYGMKFYDDDTSFNEAIASIKKSSETITYLGPVEYDELPVRQDPNALADENFPYWLLKETLSPTKFPALFYIDTTSDIENITVKAFVPKAVYMTYTEYMPNAQPVVYEKGVCLGDINLKIFNEPKKINQTFDYENNYSGRVSGLKKKYTYGTNFNQSTAFFVNGDEESLQINGYVGDYLPNELLTEYKYGKRKYSATIPYGDYMTTDGTVVRNYFPKVGDRHIPLRTKDNNPLAYNRDLTPCQFEIYWVRIDINATGGFEGFNVEGIEVTKVI